MSTNRYGRSKLYRLLDYILRLVLLNFLIVIPSFSFLIVYSFISKDTQSIWFYLTLIPTLIWFFPSIVATADVIRQYEENDTNTVFKDFFKSFKRVFFRAFIASMFIYVVAFGLYNSFIFFNTYQSQGTIYVIGLVLTLSFAIFAIIVAIHVPLVMAYFTNLSVWHYFKLALIMAFKDLLGTTLMVITVIAMGTLAFLFYYIMLFGAISVTIYVIIKLSYKNYIKIYRKVEE